MPNRNDGSGSSTPSSVSEDGVEIMMGLLIGGRNLARLRGCGVGEGYGEHVCAKYGGGEIVRGWTGMTTLRLGVGRKMDRVWANEEEEENEAGICCRLFLVLRLYWGKFRNCFVARC